MSFFTMFKPKKKDFAKAFFYIANRKENKYKHFTFIKTKLYN